MPIAFDAAQARFDRQQGTGHPAMLLVRRPPPIHFVGQLPDLRQERLQTVGRLPTDAERFEEAQPMQGQRLLQAFVQAGRGRAVDRVQLVAELAQRRPGLRVAGPLIRLL